MGRAVKGIVTAEMLLTLTGIGAMIMQYGSPSPPMRCSP